MAESSALSRAYVSLGEKRWSEIVPGSDRLLTHFSLIGLLVRLPELPLEFSLFFTNVMSH